MGSRPRSPDQEGRAARGGRSEFQRWRCLLNPTEAQNSSSVEPWAKLTVKVEEAVGLLSADTNGLSDPFVVLSMNGPAIPELRTHVISRTLAPKWREVFTLDVYYPLSTLTLQVMDADALDSDDLIGFLDLQLSRLSLSGSVEGWFELRHPEEFSDTLKARMRVQELKSKDAGRIHLKLTLHAEGGGMDEFFAACMEWPCAGHGYEHYDLGKLFASLMRASSLLLKLLVPLLRVKSWAFRHSTLVALALILLIWEPVLVLPALALLAGLVLARDEFWEAEAGAADVGHEDTKRSETTVSLDSEGCPKRPARGVPLCGRALPKRFARRRSVDSSPPTAAAAQSSSRRAASQSPSGSTAAQSPSGSPERENATVRRAAWMMQKLVPGSKRIYVRMAQSLTDLLIRLLVLVHGMLNTRRRGLSKACFAAAPALLVLGRWQLFLVKVCLTMAVIVIFFPLTTPGRIWKTAVYYMAKRNRLHEDHHLLERDDCNFLHVVPPRKSVGRVHVLRPNRLLKPTRCFMCGQLTARGLSAGVPLRCEICRVVVCAGCSGDLRDDCRGFMRRKPSSHHVSLW
ncbi:unnamed protein product [Prorocentrum cordatum]|uniref:C2 domain-containing protein n=1 Tax=Prorocentrum cordatum TaxID=2364126 RepID=A0ABN9SVC6_9DINO|nr:unnamed protein product [Polarella glacialis]